MAQKGQYFSFDAVIATVIMVLAFSTLVAYWYGAQAVVEERTNSRLADAGRIAESLLSPGSPADWDNGMYITDIRQIGIATGFNNGLDSWKVRQFKSLSEQDYEGVGRLLRAGGDYYVLIERTEQTGAPVAEIGKPYPANSSYVVVANRGVTYEGHPARMRVFLWKQ